MELKQLDEFLGFKIEMDRSNPDVLAEVREWLVRLGNADLGRYWLWAAHRALATYYDEVNDPQNAAEQRRLADPRTPQ